MKAENALVGFLIKHPRIRDISFKPCILDFERAIIVDLSIADAEGFERYGDHKIIKHSELLFKEKILIDTLEAIAKELEDTYPPFKEYDGLERSDYLW